MQRPPTARPSSNARILPGGRSRGRPGDKLTPGPEIPGSANYKFLKMPLSEIQKDMKEYDHSVSKEQLQVPSPESTREVFEFFIENITGKRPEHLAQPTFGCLEDIPYNDLYEDAVPAINYMREVQKIFSAAQFNEFGLRDIHAPEKSRFLWQMSAIINFAKFRLQRYQSKYEDLVVNSDQLADQASALAQEKAQLLQEIGKIQDVRKAEEPEVIRLKESNDANSAKLDAMCKEQREVTQRTHEQKAKLKKGGEQLTMLTAKLATDREELKRMKSRIVSSPDRVRVEIKEMGDQLEEGREYVAGLQKRARTLSMRADAFRKARQLVQAARLTADECVEAKALREELEQEVEERSAKKGELLQEGENVRKVLEHLEKQIESIDTKLARLAEQRREIDNEETDQDRKLANDSKQLDVEMRELRQQLDKKKAQATHIQEDINHCVRSYSHEIASVRRTQEMLLEKFNSFNNDVHDIANEMKKEREKAYDQLTNAVQGFTL